VHRRGREHDHADEHQHAQVPALVWMFVCSLWLVAFGLGVALAHLVWARWRRSRPAAR
jgi:hypothetical protein